MPFFIRNNKKSKNSSKAWDKQKQTNKSRETKKALNEDISSESDDEEVSDGLNRKSAKRKDEERSSSDSEETPQEKKIRLAKIYLEEIERQERQRNDNQAVDTAVIGGRLRDEVLEQSGRLHRKVADNYIEAKVDQIVCLKNGHKLSVTCCVLSTDSKYIFSASKDCSIIKWDLECAKRVKTIHNLIKTSKDNAVGHRKHILCLAISSDNKFLASGCYDKIINIWNPDSMEWIHTFRGHRSAVSGLAFRKGFHQLFSSSFDRSVKVWNLDEMSYVETLFGHQESIMAIDSLLRERAITAGGSDSSLRIWKIVEESQLVFQGNNSSIDCVKLIDEQHFVSASDDGTISLWSVLKKKPLISYPNSHGMGTSGANWITSLAVMRNTDLIASGSKDSMIRLWKISNDFKKLEPLFTIPAIGFVNSLEFSSNGRYIVASIGREHRLGRWWTIKEAKNSIMIIPLILNS